MAKYVAYFLWDLYDWCRLWYIQTLVRSDMRDLNLSFILRSDINYRELLDLVNVVDGFDWSKVPISKTLRGTIRVDSSLCRTGDSGDFVWYDPYTSELFDARTARDFSRTSNLY